MCFNLVGTKWKTVMSSIFNIVQKWSERKKGSIWCAYSMIPIFECNLILAAGDSRKTIKAGVYTRTVKLTPHKLARTRKSKSNNIIKKYIQMFVYNVWVRIMRMRLVEIEFYQAKY